MARRDIEKISIDNGYKEKEIYKFEWDMSAAAAQRGAGGERKAPCKRHDTATLPKSVPCRRESGI